MTRISSLPVILLCAALLFSPAYAEDLNGPPPAAPCALIDNAIIPLKPPSFDGGVVWRRLFGQEGMDRISELVPLANGGVVALGESAPFARTSGAQPVQLYFLNLEAGGKPLVEKRVAVKNFVRVAGAVIAKDKIVVLSQLRDDKNISSGSLDIFNGAGAIEKTVALTDAKYNFVAEDIIANGDGTLTVAATAVNRGDTTEGTTVLLRLDANGKTLFRRDYLPGVSTRLEQIRRLADGRMIGTGRIGLDRQRSAGWALMVDRDGKLIWQRPYGRGSQSQLNRAIDDGGGGLYAVGEVIPSDGSTRAGWVLHLNADGLPIWQRFFSGKYKYSALDLVAQKNGLLMVLLAGRPAGEGGREHARILSMSSLGNLVASEAYLEGTNALPTRFLENKTTGKRLLAGYAQTGMANNTLPDSQRLATYDAWIAGLPEAINFTDACRPVQSETLDDLE